MNLKAIMEKRNTLIASMRELTAKASAETRAMTSEEISAFDAAKAEVENLNATIDAIRSCDKEGMQLEGEPAAGSNADTTANEIRSFAKYIRTATYGETRTAVNMTESDNSALVPKSIAGMIITKVKEISPLYAQATRFTIKGELAVPYYDETTNSITVAYADEFTTPESSIGKVLSVNLKGYLIRAFALVSRKLVNESTDNDLVQFVVNKMAEDMAVFIDKELIKGTSDKITGLSTAKQIVTTASSTAITADELIELQDKVPDAFQKNAIWIMSGTTRTAIRKLKDGEGRYLFNCDPTGKWNGLLFSKPVYVSEGCDDIAAGNKVIYYLDPTGLSIKDTEEINVTVLLEKYAEQHAIGILGFADIDAKVTNQQKVAALQMKASS